MRSIRFQTTEKTKFKNIKKAPETGAFLLTQIIFMKKQTFLWFVLN